MKQKILWSFVLVFYVVELVSAFPNGFPGDRCFKARTVTGCKASDIGCNGTLLNVFTPNSSFVRRVGPNTPDTQFLLFTRSNRIRPEFLHECSGRLPGNTKFDPKAWTVFIVHDILDGSCRTSWMREMKDQLLIRDKYNVILVDWTWVNFEYPLDRNIQLVSEHIAYVVKNIMKDKKIDGDMFHFIGHGFGAINAGYAGDLIKEPKKIRRITALDPSCLTGSGLGNRTVHTNHAQLVDVIHTKEGNCLDGIGFGFSDRVGHADFYVNRGKVLTSTVIDHFASVKKGENYYAFLCQDRAICDHYQAINYFMTSINACDCQFVSMKCKIDNKKGFCGEKGEECAVMGMDWELYPPNEGKQVFKEYLEYCPSLSGFYPYCDQQISDAYKNKFKLTKKQKFCGNAA